MAGHNKGLFLTRSLMYVEHLQTAFPQAETLGSGLLPSAICHLPSTVTEEGTEKPGERTLNGCVVLPQPNMRCFTKAICGRVMSWVLHNNSSPWAFGKCVLPDLLCSLIGPTGWILDNGMWAEVRMALCAWDSTPGLSVFGQLYLEFHVFKMSFLLLTKLSESFFAPLFHTRRIPRHRLSRLFPKYLQHLTTCHHLDPGPDTTTSAWISAVASPALGPLHS